MTPPSPLPTTAQHSDSEPAGYSSRPAALEARGIEVRFGGVAALLGVDFTLRPGEVHAICGENGAGKSTLIKLLSGLYPWGAYHGELFRNGGQMRLAGVADAEAAGIAVVYQELALVPAMTVAENICLGSELLRGGLLDEYAMHARARSVLAEFGLSINPSATLGHLGIGQQQLIELVRGLSKRKPVLILDEPSAALSGPEVRTLLDVIKGLKRRMAEEAVGDGGGVAGVGGGGGGGVVYISHKLDEVFEVADRITVLRDGRTVGTFNTSEVDQATIVRHMVGREVGAAGMYGTRVGASATSVSAVDSVALSVQGLSVGRARGDGLAVHGVSFEVRRGEIVGIGGLMGAGRSELLMNLMGVEGGGWGRRMAGRVFVNVRGQTGKGTLLHSGDTPGAIRAGMVLVSENRKRYGLVLEESVDFNLSLMALCATSDRMLIDDAAQLSVSRDFARLLQVRAASLEMLVNRLSGGNQQKVVLGNALRTRPGVLLLDEPTRGVDVGAREEIYRHVRRLTVEGMAVVVVSSELPELMGLSDQIVMLHNGRVTGRFERGRCTAEQLLLAAMGKSS